MTDPLDLKMHLSCLNLHQSIGTGHNPLGGLHELKPKIFLGDTTQGCGEIQWQEKLFLRHQSCPIFSYGIKLDEYQILNDQLSRQTN